MGSTLSNLFIFKASSVIEEERGVFIPKDLIFLPLEKDPEIDFNCIGGNFKDRFLSKEIDVGPISGREIYFYDSGVLDSEGVDLVHKELWQVENSINIRELYSLLRKQKRGETTGGLCINGYRNLFSVTDLSGEICVVTVYYKHGWHILSRDVAATNNSQYAGYPVRIFTAKRLF